MMWKDYDPRLKKLYSAISKERGEQSSHHSRTEGMLDADKLMEELTIALREKESE